MARAKKFDGRVRRPVKFGEGLQPGTVEWEQMRPSEAAAERRSIAMEKNHVRLCPTRGPVMAALLKLVKIFAKPGLGSTLRDRRSPGDRR